MLLKDIQIVESSEGKKCRHFRVDTGQCTTGCKVKKVKKGNMCPYDVEEQHQCPCFG